jgi:hypothetical protein
MLFAIVYVQQRFRVSFKMHRHQTFEFDKYATHARTFECLMSMAVQLWHVSIMRSMQVCIVHTRLTRQDNRMPHVYVGLKIQKTQIDYTCTSMNAHMFTR